MKISVALRALTETKAEETYKVARKKRLHGWLELGRVVGLVDNGPSDQTAAQTSNSSRTEGIPRKDGNGCWYGGCDRHGKTDEETEWMLLKCSGCKKARYCSKECQSKDWKVLHKLECRSMRP
jgi:MYND finger